MFQPGFLGGGAVNIANTDSMAATGIGIGATQTFTNRNLGTAAADRVIIAALISNTSAGTDITSVTIGGVAATKRVMDVRTPGSTFRAEIWTASVPTGATGNVAITSGSASTWTVDVALYAMTGAAETPASTANTNGAGTALTVTPNQFASGAVVGAAFFNYAVGTVTTTWTGLTKDYENSVTFLDRTTASIKTNAGGTLTVTVTPSSAAVNSALVAASWQPL